MKFNSFDYKGESIVCCVNINIKGLKSDTTISLNENGSAKLYLPQSTYKISLSTPQFTSIDLNNLVTQANKGYIIRMYLGNSNTLRIIEIYSVRKLSDTEINKIIDDLSNAIQDNELIKNKTCYVVEQI
jgi:hypothetical protein